MTNTTQDERMERLQIYSVKADRKLIEVTKALWPEGQRAEAIRRGWRREVERELRERGVVE